MKTVLKRTNIGASDSVVAYMVKIDWTSAPVVKITAKQDLLLDGFKVAVVRDSYTPLGTVKIAVDAGQTVYFAASKLAGYYYPVQQGNCLCPANRVFRHECHHKSNVAAFVARQEARKQHALPLIVEEEQNPRDFEQGGWTVPAGTIYRVTGPQDTQFVFADWLLNCWQCTCGGGGVPQCEHCDAVERYQQCEVEAA